jgi:hypothetical protein
MTQLLNDKLTLISALLFLTPSIAFAQTQAPGATGAAEAHPGKMHVGVPPPPPKMERNARVHNGFYLRGGLGAGGLWPNLLDRSEDPDAVDFDGGGFVLEFDALVGGSPAPGFAVGGGVFLVSGPVDLSGSGEKFDTNMTLFMVGPFFDAFPDPKGGWHLGAMLGFAGHRIPDHPSGIESTAGFGGSAFVGYDWWVSHEISAGAMLKFNGAITNAEENDATLRASSTGLTLMLTALYH